MKTKLAINGGEKTIQGDQGRFIWPELTERTKQRVLEQLAESISIYNRSGVIERLEDSLKDYHGVKHALLTNSGTSALHSMFVGENFGEGDEVLVPGYTFYATVTPLLFTNATPVLVDCDDNGNMCPSDLESKITKKSKGVIVTHMWGVPAQMKAISEIAQNNNLLLMEDGSHAHGATLNGKKVGSFGHSSAFSMQGQKTLTGGEGGFLLTDEDEVFYRALMLGHYNKRCKQEIPADHPLSIHSVTGMGLKFRIHPIAAAIAEEQLDNLDGILRGRREIAQYMINSLSGLPGLKLPRFEDSIKPSWYAFTIGYESDELGGLSRERFFEAVQAEGLMEVDIPGSTCPLNYHSLFQNPSRIFPKYDEKIKYVRGDLPNAERFHSRLLKLPVWHSEGHLKKVDLYIKGITKVIENHREINKNG